MSYSIQTDITQTGSIETDAGDICLTESTGKKWTYMVYFAADNNLESCCLYDIIQLQQAILNPGIDLYILVDRPAENNQRGDLVTINGTYKWDSQWTDTRVGKITADPGLTVSVDWESWGELDTGSPDTLTRFINWTKEQSPSENYGLIMWDHGRETTNLCFDETPDPDNSTSLTISGVAEILKDADNIPLVIFNNCLLGSEIVATQLAGSTSVVVTSEPISYSQSTYSYKVFFNTVTQDMTPAEIADVMVRNVQGPEYEHVITMLSAVDVSDSRLGDALEAFALAVYGAGNTADKTVLVNAMRKAMQDGCVYDGARFQQSDLYDLILQAMADSSYENTSEGFKTHLATVKAVFEDIVLSYRCVPAGHGYGIAFCNTICSAMKLIGSGTSVKQTKKLIKDHLNAAYRSNPRWGDLLYDLSIKFLFDESANLFIPATFTVTGNSDLVQDKVVPVADFGCFSGQGAGFDGIDLMGDYFFQVAITAADVSTGKIRLADDTEGDVTVSILAGDGSPVASGLGSVSFADLAPGNYFVRLQSDTDGWVRLFFEADWMTGVDRFDYARSGLNVKNADGNGTYDKATPLSEGYYPGLLTHTEDTDIYRVGDLYAEQYNIKVESSSPINVAEYDENHQLVKAADASSNNYTLTMKSGNFLVITGNSDLEQNAVDSYSVFISDLVKEPEVQIENLVGTPDGVSWQASSAGAAFILNLSMDDFTHVLTNETDGTSLDLLNLPAGTYQWRVKAESGSEWTIGENIVSENNADIPKILRSETDGDEDLFFASPNGTWGENYYARHTGSAGSWTGIEEMVPIAGKNRIQDLFFGSADPNTLVLTDSENGDALFADDIYTDLPEGLPENTFRLSRIQHIEAGGGDDIVDMTSQQFEYVGNIMTISGGDGNDTIWADKISSRLFGDDGNDRLVGSSGNDVIVGGRDNDSMHGGGGTDIFVFGENWGVDTVQQLEDGMVTLWFASGSEINWNAASLTYTDGENSVNVSGVDADKITLKFGSDGSNQFTELFLMGAFEEIYTNTIFEVNDTGSLASL